MNLKLFLFLQINLDSLIALFFYQSKIMFIFVMCCATYVLLKDENMYVF
jgi:hypothetical protein